MDTSALIIGDRRKRQIQASEIAVCAAGRIANVHARNIAAHPSTSVKYVVDLSGAAAERLARAPARVGRRWEGDRKRIFDADAARAQAAAAGAAIYFWSLPSRSTS